MAVDKLIDSTLLNNNLTLVADAIREKTGGTQSLTFPSDFVNEIKKIKTEYTLDEDADICFWDYDGTLLYSFSFEEIQLIENLPPTPDHSQDEIPLTFFAWNWSLEDLQALTVPMDVGAMYYPTDGKMHWTYRLNDATGLTCSFSTSYTTDAIIDWGDGTVEHWGTGTENGEDPTHTYANNGTYHCSWEGEGRPDTAMRTEGNSAVVGTFYVGSAHVKEWLGNWWSGTFNGSSVEYIVGLNRVMPQNFSSMKYLKFFVECKGTNNYSLQYCPNLKLVCFPNVDNTNGGDYILCNSGVKRLRMPFNMGFTRFLAQNCPNVEFWNHSIIGYRSFQSCTSLRRLVINGTVDSESFYNCPIEEIWCGLDEPPTLADSKSFASMPASGIIHVKASALEAFKEATNWSVYADRMVGDWSGNPIK